MNVACAECGNRLADPDSNPLYVVALDEYFCDGKCWDVFRKRDVLDSIKIRSAPAR